MPVPRFSLPTAVDRRRWWAASALIVPLTLVVLGVVIPLGYLGLRAFQAEPSELVQLVVRWRNVRLLGNTAALALGVLAVSTLLAAPAAWLVARTDLPGRRFFTLLGVLPLAVPGYVMAYALLAATGPRGTLAEIGLDLPRAGGYWGAIAALGLYTAPYLFLNLRAALLGIDPALEESARSLGATPGQALRRVVLPQLRPAFLSGALLVVLHALGDFGVVSLMRFETFSYAIYLQYSASYDRVYAAWLAIMLLGLTGALLWAEARLLIGRRYDRSGTGTARLARRHRLGAWRLPAMAGLVASALVGVALPVATTVYWLGRGAERSPWADLAGALLDSAGAAFPAALLAAALALPVAYLGVRRPGPGARLLERAAYLGYATPPLAFALALVVFALSAAPVLYQTFVLLVLAYALHFLAEGVGPVRSALYQAPPQLEEAARALGTPPVAAFFRVTFPLLRRGLVVSVAFVFLSALKELPITFLLAPLGHRSLAMGVWSAAGEAYFSVAAPYALALIAVSTLLVGLLLVERAPEARETAGKRRRWRAFRPSARVPAASSG